MFNSVILEIVIGLIFIYLLYSLLATDWRLLYGGDFTTEFSYEEQRFQYARHCHTKHCPASVSNRLLPTGRFVFLSWYYELFIQRNTLSKLK